MSVEPSVCPKCGKILVEVGDDKRFLECICGFKFDTFTSREVPRTREEASGPEVAGSNIRERAHALAERIMEEKTFATLNGSEEILYYDGGIYREGGELQVKALAQDLAPTADLGNYLVAEIIGHVKRSTYVSPDKFQEPTSVLVLENCLLDVENMQTSPHTPDHYALSKLPVLFEASADCPAIKKFLGDVLYPEDVPFLQEWAGYHLVRGYPVAIAALFVGDGANGKSTLINLFRAFLGPKNIAAVPLQAFERNAFAKSTLFGKLANLYPDLSDEALKQVGTFKALTGQDMITAEKKFGQPFNFVNTAKLTFSCNVVPEVWEDTDAFFRRIWIVQFPNSFHGSRADPDLLAKLTTQNELSGFLNWALEGLKRLRENRWHFTGTRSTADVKADYIRRSDTVKAFLNGCTTRDAAEWVTRDVLYTAYCEYCRKRGLVAKERQAFFEKLPQVGQFGKSQRTVNGKRFWAVDGLKLLEEKDWEKQPTESASVVLNGEKGVQAVQEELPDAQPAQPTHPNAQLREHSDSQLVRSKGQSEEETAGPKARLSLPRCEDCGKELGKAGEPAFYTIDKKHYCKVHFLVRKEREPKREDEGL
jgi:P4 family phage/plasmid primase-like protien